MYAALCGNLARILPACHSWEDMCWAYARALLDLSVDQQLAEQPDMLRPSTADSRNQVRHAAHWHRFCCVPLLLRSVA